MIIQLPSNLFYKVPLPLPILVLSLVAIPLTSAQQQRTTTADSRTRAEELRFGSQTAKGGFQNEDEIRDKFRSWRTDLDAQAWLEAMNYPIEQIEQVRAEKPHGEKADVEITISTKSSQKTEGVSIKLVSNPQGFNQIDKRWLKSYAQKWKMPDEVYEALRLFLGDLPPTQPSRDVRRMFLDELSETQQRAIVDFFKSNRGQIVSDLFAGDGEHSAGWFMVTLKTIDKPKIGKSILSSAESSAASSTDPTRAKDQPTWKLCRTKEAIEYFGTGDVQITPAGNLKIGRISMQRKGGDNGRESANMLQFKINPTELFELQK